MTWLSILADFVSRAKSVALHVRYPDCARSPSENFFLEPQCDLPLSFKQEMTS